MHVVCLEFTRCDLSVLGVLELFTSNLKTHLFKAAFINYL